MQFFLIRLHTICHRFSYIEVVVCRCRRRLVFIYDFFLARIESFWKGNRASISKFNLLRSLLALSSPIEAYFVFHLIFFCFYSFRLRIIIPMTNILLGIELMPRNRNIPHTYPAQIIEVAAAAAAVAKNTNEANFIK